MELNFESFGLDIHKVGQNCITYIKRVDDKSHVEVFNYKGSVSIDLCWGNHRMIIATRYQCHNQDELTFLLLGSSRIKYLFT